MNKRVLSILCVLLGGIILCGCGDENRKAVTAKTFINTMSVHKFIVTDITDQFETEEIVSAQIASQEDADYQIEFQEYVSVVQAKNFFEGAKSAIATKQLEEDQDVSYEEGNYEEYTLLSDGVYYYVARIDNTIIYVVAYEEYSEEIKTYSKELGYFY